MTNRYDAWNRALAARFLQERENEPLYLYMDEPVLQEVAGEAGADSGGAAQAFVAAVRDTVGGDRPFARWERVSRETPTPDEVPRYFAVLCFLVFVAVEREGTQFSYYPGLNRALGRPADAGAPGGFDQDVSRLFSRFNEWLSSTRHGTATAEPTERYPHVGWALSQAVVRPADRALIVRTFGAANLRPGMRLAAADLTARLLPRLRAAAASPSRSRLLELANSHRGLFEGLVRQLYAAWDGSADVATGPRSVQVRFCYEELSGEWWFLGPVLPGAQGRRWTLGSAVGTLGLVKGLEAVPQEMWSLVGSGEVGSVEGGPTLKSPARAVRWLSIDTRVGGWAEVGQRDEDLDQLALVQEGSAAGLEALPGVERRGVPSPGYVLLFVARGVAAGHPLADVPVHRKPRLHGGLALRRMTNTYLLGAVGAPEVIDITSTTASLDGIEVPVTGGRVAVGGRGLEEGDHVLVADGHQVRFRLSDRLLAVGDVVDGPSWYDDLDHPVRMSVPHDGGTVWIVGADGACAERKVAECRWATELGLFANEADVTGVVGTVPFVPAYVVSTQGGGHLWVTRVPEELREGDDSAEQENPDWVRARDLVSALLAGCNPPAMQTEKEWRRMLAALMRKVHR